MRRQREPVITSLGTMNGRDAIYLDELRQLGDTLCFIGEINTSLCTNLGDTHKWLSYKLRFAGTASYRAWSIDSYPLALKPASSFDTATDSIWADQNGTPGLTHYILSTYDYVYEILAQNFEMELGDMREQEKLKEFKASFDETFEHEP